MTNISVFPSESFIAILYYHNYRQSSVNDMISCWGFPSPPSTHASCQCSYYNFLLWVFGWWKKKIKNLQRFHINTCLHVVWVHGNLIETKIPFYKGNHLHRMTSSQTCSLKHSHIWLKIWVSRTFKSIRNMSLISAFAVYWRGQVMNTVVITRCWFYHL